MTMCALATTTDLEAVYRIHLAETHKKQCPICQSTIHLDYFRDSSSRMEYCLTQLCQTCQDLLGPSEEG